MRVFCRLSWEEESNVSTGDDNSPAGKCEFFFYIPSGSKFNFFTLVFLVKKSVKIAKIYCHTILDLAIENRPCHGFGSHLD